jgi:hypothetical protein
VALGACCAAHRNLGLGIESSLAADRRQKYRAGPTSAEQLDADINLARIDQAAHPDVDLRKVLVVGPQRRVVIHAGGQIAEMGRGQCLARRRFEVHDVERLVGRGDDVAHRLGRRAQEVVALPERRFGKGGYQRAQRSQGCGSRDQRAAGKERRNRLRAMSRSGEASRLV